MRRFRVPVLISVFALIFVTLASPFPTRADVLAPNWVIYDASNEAVLDSQQMDQQVPMASLTKVMTGLLVAENLSPADEVTIVEEDLVGEANIEIEPGDVLTVRTLLHGLMMRSGNDAAAALARAGGGSPDDESTSARERFIGLMNERARELDMNDTHFENPHGLDAPQHYSTARDLVRLTEEAMNHPRLMQAFGARTYSGEGFTFNHSNQLPLQFGYEGVLGGKTGWTNNAGLCLIQLVERDGRMLIVVLLGSNFERWYPDAIELADYGWSVPEPATSPQRAGAAFDWWRQRTDGPIERGETARSWLWGPEPNSLVRYQHYQDAPDGERLIQYFDKGRMEINDPDAPIASGWYVTGGHLAREMITGEYQIGDGAFLYRGPARVPVAGDPGNDGPTYANLDGLMERQHTGFGDTVTLALGPGGSTEDESHLAGYDVELIDHDLETGHGVASVFDEYLETSGPAVERGQVVETRLFDPKYALVGLPITEPAWTRVPVGGETRDVLVQCFERRCLTYTPSNDEDWRVEMANIGQHYLSWARDSRIQSLYEIPYRFDPFTGDEQNRQASGGSETERGDRSSGSG